jgi:agmatine deiminase
MCTVHEATPRAAAEDRTTLASTGYAMPAEWEPHAACLMAWPTRQTLWHDRFDDAKRDYAAVAHAIADFEPVLMVCLPGTAAEVRNLCGGAIEAIELPIDDSWTRDNGPIFVRDGAGRIAAVGFGFNGWGGRWPHDEDAQLPVRIAEHLGMRLFCAPFVLEGGSILVDGQGTLITTEQCLLHPNRNPDLTREEIEQGLRDYLGVTTIVWLPNGHHGDVGPASTDGHVDGVVQFMGPGRVLLEVPADPASPGHRGGLENLDRLRGARDARGTAFEVSVLDPGTDPGVSYANHYLANGAAVVPVGGTDSDGGALEFLRTLYPGREVVAVPGRTLAYGGGGPHCITQQIPEGPAAPAA